MEIPEKLIGRIYSENDFGRSLATSISGIVGLITYYFSNDWVISLLSIFISFPVIRVIVTRLNDKFKKPTQQKIRENEAMHIYKSLSKQEKEIVNVFVSSGSCVLTWSQINNSSIYSNGIESLIQRELMRTSMTADGMRETFVLDTAVFDVGAKKRTKIKPELELKI